MAHVHLIRFSAGLLAAATAVSSCSREPAPQPQPAADQPPVMRLSADTNGLLRAERQRYYHLSEGGELYPVDWLLALETEATGQDGRTTMRPFLENIERFGLIPDDKSPENPYGLPVGLTVAPSIVTGAEMVGLNCTACHVGEIWYRGTRVRIDGGPGMALVNGFIKSVIQETELTLKHPVRGVRFLEALKETRVRRPAGLPPPAPGGCGKRGTSGGRPPRLPQHRR